MTIKPASTAPIWPRPWRLHKIWRRPQSSSSKGAEPTLVRTAGDSARQSIATAPVEAVDTMAAGDSLAAGYSSRRVDGESVAVAAAFGDRLAARVIPHRGALIDRAAMDDLLAIS